VIDCYEEIAFYSRSIGMMIDWLHDAIKASVLGDVWNIVVSYQKIVICTEDATTMRSLGIVYFSQGSFNSSAAYNRFMEVRARSLASPTVFWPCQLRKSAVVTSSSPFCVGPCFLVSGYLLCHGHTLRLFTPAPEVSFQYVFQYQTYLAFPLMTFASLLLSTLFLGVCHRAFFIHALSTSFCCQLISSYNSFICLLSS